MLFTSIFAQNPIKNGLTTPASPGFCRPQPITKTAPFFGRMLEAVPFEMAIVRILVEYFPKHRHDELKRRLHASSANVDRTNGDSVMVAFRDPLRMLTQTRTESTRIAITKIMKMPQTAASRRALKISAAVSGV